MLYIIKIKNTLIKIEKKTKIYIILGGLNIGPIGTNGFNLAHIASDCFTNFDIFSYECINGNNLFVNSLNNSFGFSRIAFKN